MGSGAGENAVEREGSGIGSSAALPSFALASGHRRSLVTASHVYGFVSCEHAVWLAFYGDPERKLEASASLEQVLRRGRELEAEIVAELGWGEPEYGERDWVAGAAETLRLLRSGVDGLCQGVLYEEPYLGLPDLLRREEGASALGDFHYVVGDIKSSRRPRTDQALQVAFYSRLLEGVQQRKPDYGYLVLKDGREERLDLAALDVVLDEVLAEMRELLACGPGEARSRPHHGYKCRSCTWRELCEERGDVHWVPGLTRSVRRLLVREGFDALAALASVDAREMAARGVLPESTWERAKQGARARIEKRPVRLRRPRLGELRKPAVCVSVLYDAFAERVPVIACCPAEGEGESLVLHAPAREDEDLCWRRLFAELGGAGASILHAGGFPARLYESLRAFPELAEDVSGLERRALDLMALVRGTWVFPTPVTRPSDALAQLRGAGVQGADEEGSVALALERGDRDALEAMAREELAALRALLGELEDAQ